MSRQGLVAVDEGGTAAHAACSRHARICRHTDTRGERERETHTHSPTPHALVRVVERLCGARQFHRAPVDAAKLAQLVALDAAPRARDQPARDTRVAARGGARACYARVAGWQGECVCVWLWLCVCVCGCVCVCVCVCARAAEHTHTHTHMAQRTPLHHTAAASALPDSSPGLHAPGQGHALGRERDVQRHEE
jgi:hypothetical protein